MKQTRKFDGRAKVLDAAEYLFSKEGYHGVSLRQVAELAGVELGALTHHFPSKDQLFSETLRRRFDELSQDRMRLLDDARIRADGRSPTIDEIISAYVEPVIRRNAESQEWRNYSRLLSRDISDANVSAILADVKEPTSSHFVSAFRMALPGVPAKDVYWGYQFMRSALLGITAETGWIDRLSRGLCRSDDIEGAARRMIPFLGAGFARLLADRSPQASSGAA